MPEGPESKRTAEYLNKYFKNNSITDVNIIKGRYKTHDYPCGYDLFKQKLPLKVLKVKCKGKFIYFILEAQIFIFNTLGMAGYWTTQNTKHSNIILETKKGPIYFNDQRNFGTIKFIFTKDELDRKLKNIGPDVLSKSITFDIFYNQLSQYPKKKIGKIFMDQTVISGIGNYLRSEILWYARISPFRQINNLKPNEFKLLFEYSTKLPWIYYNLEKAIKSKILSSKDKYLYEDLNCCYKHIELKKAQKACDYFAIYRREYDKLGNKVKTEKLGDRTIHWIPKLQK